MKKISKIEEESKEQKDEGCFKWRLC